MAPLQLKAEMDVKNLKGTLALRHELEIGFSFYKALMAQLSAAILWIYRGLTTWIVFTYNVSVVS